MRKDFYLPETHFFRTFYLVTFLLLFVSVTSPLYGQTPGLIIQRAQSPGTAILDPNGDGYTSRTSSGFVNGQDMGTASELPFRFLPQMPNPSGPEPTGDLVTGASGGHTDLVNAPLAMGFTGTHVLFRVRVGGNSTASKGYSFLIDSDGVFNKQKLANGTLVDYATPSKVKNLGFEYEVVLALNFDVVVYRHSGSGDQNDPVSSNVIWRGSANGGYNRYFQKSVAASTASGNPDFFFDFYIPLTAFAGDGGSGISPDSPLRISGSTVTSAQTGLEGTISDIGGVNDKLYNNDKIRIWKELIPIFPPTSLNQLMNGEFCSAAPVAPGVNSPITTASTSIAGTSTEIGSTVKVYRNGIELIPVTPVTVGSNGTWSFNLLSGISLNLGDVITARIYRPGSGSCPEVTSVSSNSVTVTNVIKGQCDATPPTSMTLNNGSKSINIVTAYSGLTSQTLKVYLDGNLLTGTVVATSTSTTYTFTPSTSSNQFAFAYDNSNATSYGTLTATVVVGSCESRRSPSYYLSGNSFSTSPTAKTTAQPAISTTTLCSATTTLTGTSAANSYIYLYVDGEPVLQSSNGSIVSSAQANASGMWSIDLRHFSIMNGDVLSVRAKEPDASASTSNPFKGLSALSAGVTMGTCATATPVITGTYCPSATVINGTSTEANGTLVSVYRREGSTPNPATDTRIIEAATVSGNAWSAPVAGFANLQGGQVLYAIATAPGKTESGASTAITVQSPATAASYGLSINAPIRQGATTISGTSTTNGTIFLYIDGEKIASTATVTGASGTTPVTWTINLSAANQQNLSTGVPVSASIAPSGGGCESQQTAATFVSCNTPSTNPTISPLSQTICSGNPAIITVNNSQDGVIYQIFNNNEASGAATLGNGGTITLRSAPLVGVGSTVSLTVRAYRVESSSCSVTLNGSSTVTIREGLTVYTASPATQALCNGSTATISLSGSQTGVNYQLQVYNTSTSPYSFTNVGSAVAGTGSALTFTTPSVTANTRFKVVATNGTCTTDMGDPVDVNVTTINQGLTITPTSQAVCSGSGTTTASVTIQSSQSGINYRLFNITDNTFTGNSVAGTGGSISLTSGAISGTVGSTKQFKVVATPASPTGCSGTDLTQQFSVTISNSAPSATPAVTVVSPICSGSPAAVTITNSQNGVSYQVQLISGTAEPFTYTNLGSPVSGTGGTITLSTSVFTSGTYNLRVLATNGCGSTPLSQTATVTVNPRPTAFNLSPVVQTVCSNTAASFVLAGSQTGVNYQLQRFNGTSFVNVGTAVAGTGSTLSFTSENLTANSTFKVIASNGTCSVDMGSSVTVNVLPASITVNPNSQLVCSGNSTTVTLLSSQNGVSYQIFNGSTAFGNTVTGTGGDITLTTNSFPSAGTYNLSVRATISGSTNCFTTYSNVFSVTVPNSAPATSLSVTPTSANICLGNTASITIGSSENNVSYQLQLESGTSPNFTYTNHGSPVVGTGGNITIQTLALSAGTYTFRILASNGCTSAALAQKVVVTVNAALNTGLSITPASQTLCSGSTASVTVASPQAGVSYRLYNVTTNAFSGNVVVAPTGASSITLTSGALTQVGTNTFKIITSNSCSTTEQTQTVSVNVSPAPVAPTISASATTVCGSGNVTISATGNLVSGVTYQLYRNGVAEGSTITYTGSNTVSFTAAVSSGSTNFTIVASSTNCSPATSSAATVTVSATPATPQITASTSTVCESGEVTITVTGGLVSGVTYQLLQNNVATGTPITFNGSNTIAFTTTINESTEFKVVASSTGCPSATSAGRTVTATNLAAISISPATQTICSGAAAEIYLNATETGVTYQIQKSENGAAYVNTGSAFTGTGSAAELTTGALTVNNTVLRVIATSGNCSKTMTGTSTVTIATAAAVQTVASSTLNQNVCRGERATITINNSVPGTNYQLLISSNGSTFSPIGEMMEGTGTMIHLQTTALNTNGSYSIKVVGYLSGCSQNQVDMSGTASISVIDCAFTYSVEPAYIVSSYIKDEIIATPEASVFVPASYELVGGTLVSGTNKMIGGGLLPGTAFSTRTGQIYVDDPAQLVAGTAYIQSRGINGSESHIVPMTYSMNDDQNYLAPARTGQPEVLPVTLISFNANKTNNGVLLAWATATEKDNDHFLVQRSLDAVNFVTVGQVAGNGNSVTVQYYNFLDKAAPSGVLYYRLKQVDFNGKVEYSKVISTLMSTAGIEQTMRVAPNPFQNKLQVSVFSNDSRQAQLEVRSLQNKVVFSKIVQLAAGENTFTNDLSQLPNGAYVISVSGAGIHVVQKVIKVD
ncbi:T9SS type A sorting domain-containing protein [Rufibacter roseus]|uniref:T9SS type A sorting domain-containing protein n=1 Tax=Rufibacter roseus TaxID=1567108 RepID=A0ABW2DQG2_9BACT|nr:T9SS type A sorting domain-containing protein [Rufibacter roseus]